MVIDVLSNEVDATGGAHIAALTVVVVVVEEMDSAEAAAGQAFIKGHRSGHLHTKIYTLQEKKQCIKQHIKMQVEIEIANMP